MNRPSWYPTGAHWYPGLSEIKKQNHWYLVPEKPLEPSKLPVPVLAGTRTDWLSDGGGPLRCCAPRALKAWAPGFQQLGTSQQAQGRQQLNINLALPSSRPVVTDAKSTQPTSKDWPGATNSTPNGGTGTPPTNVAHKPNAALSARSGAA